MRETPKWDKGSDGESAPRRHTRGPAALSNMIAGTARQLASRHNLQTLSVATRWADIAGPGLAANTQVASISIPKSGRAGTLTLKADGGAALLVQHHSREILARVNAVLGEGAIASIKVIQGTILRRVEEPKPRPPRLSGAEEEAVRQSVQGVSDPDLRDRLARLMRHAVETPQRR